ncbi:MAG TPA: PASTA domain-containing protein [Candidatus Udaeobacter sp.]|nr:PASTA domain-containing protein [Candidatus Udaeobacter sp.]
MTEPASPGGGKRAKAGGARSSEPVRIARAPEDVARDAERERVPTEPGVVPLPSEAAIAPPDSPAEAAPDPSIDPNELDLPHPPPERRHRLAGAFSVAALAIAAFATGLFLFNNLVMPRFIHVNAEVRVPDLTNLTVDQAEKQVSALHLQLSRAGERFDPSVPTGFILSQDPAEGTPVRGKRRVMVVVSLGEEFSSVPALFGESMRGARLLIDRAGLRAGGTTRAPSDEVGEGLVVASDPPAETVLPRETPVSFLVSSGAGREEYVMPELLGREITGVKRQLEAIGFRVVTPAGTSSVGGIVFQDPAPGSRITRDVTISLQAMGRLIR